MPLHCSTLFAFRLVICASIVLSPFAWAQASAQDSQQPRANAVAASNPAPLPDAPSLISSQSPAGNHLPLERQPHPAVTVLEAPFHVLQDGEHIFVAPIYLRRSDLKWLLPLTGAAAAAFATDQHTMTQVVSTNPSFNQSTANVSNGIVFGMVALPVSMFGVGEARHNEHLTETGILGGEAMTDATIVDEVVKLCSWRERPYQDDGKGRFFIGSIGTNSSFVSEHSMVAWSSAAVIAGEYHSKWAKFGVYTAAAGVSLNPRPGAAALSLGRPVRLVRRLAHRPLRLPRASSLVAAAAPTFPLDLCFLTATRPPSPLPIAALWPPASPSSTPGLKSAARASRSRRRTRGKR